MRGRRKVQDANKLYKDGLYKEAIALFEEAEKLVPDLPQLWLNKGFTCRQLIIPGSKTPDSVMGGKCALDAFKRYQQVAPQDSRGESLYVQTLFDTDSYEALAKMYEDQFKANQRNIDAVSGLIQVYTKWNKVEEALEWYYRKADIQANEAEAQYAVGVFIWQQLMTKGGGPEKAGFDPRPDPNKPKEKKVPPPWGFGDIVGQQRVDYADAGIKYLEKAVALKPKYHEAMTYVNLLYRQKSFSYFDDPVEWQKAIDKAEEWRRKSLEAQGKAVPPPAAVGSPAPTAPAGDTAAPAPAPEEKPAAAQKGKKGKKAGGKKALRRGKRVSKR